MILGLIAITLIRGGFLMRILTILNITPSFMFFNFFSSTGAKISLHVGEHALVTPSVKI
jgi:hypothetical protein